MRAQVGVHFDEAGGTGSCPPGWKGWQRATRRTASQEPRTAPKRAMACIAYSEQVGAKRQRGPSNGLIQRLYRRRAPMSSRSITILKCGLARRVSRVAALVGAGYNSALSRLKGTRDVPLVAAKKPAKKAAKAAKKAAKPAAKKIVAKKPVAKPAAKKPAPAKKPVAKKAAPAKKPVAKKAAPAKKAPAKAVKPVAKPVAKPAVAKKAAPAKPVAKAAPAKAAPVAKQPAVKQPVAKQPEVRVAAVKKPAAKPATKSAPVAPAAKPETKSPAPQATTKTAKPALATSPKPASSAAPAVTSRPRPEGKVAVAVAAKPAAPAPRGKVKVVEYKTDEGTGRPIIPQGYKPSQDEEYMSTLQVEYFRQRLLSWRADLVEESKQTIENLKDEVRDVGDEAERATRETENSLELRTRDRYRKLIGKIDSTLKRLDAGEYGYSVDSGEEIGLDRLEARLTAERTIDEQERWEHLQKQMGD